MKIAMNYCVKIAMKIAMIIIRTINKTKRMILLKRIQRYVSELRKNACIHKIKSESKNFTKKL